MPRYLASHHAVDRLLERFPSLAQVAGSGLEAAKWLGRAATRARVAAQQAGMDLMLALDLPMAGGPVRVYLPVTPVGKRDTWSIRTVLTKEQGLANIAEAVDHQQDASRAAWRRRKGFNRPFARYARGTARWLDLVAA